MDTPQDGQATRRVGERAVVVGAGMAGLCCARLLSERFDEVLVFDRDTLPDGSQWRRQVPQGRHQHLLLPARARLLDAWFPGLVEDLRSQGALDVDLNRDFYWHRSGGVWRRSASTLRSPSMSRPLLECTVRRRVEAISNVGVRDGAAVDGLTADASAARITGVRLEGSTIPCDLVVDASGRQARSLAWLQELGYEPPPTSTVEVGIRYVTHVYRRSEQPRRDWKAAAVIGDPASRRLAMAVPFEGDRWFVLLGGINGETAPTNPDAALAYARSLGSPAVAQVMQSSERLGEAVTHRFPANQRPAHRTPPPVPGRLGAGGRRGVQLQPALRAGHDVGCAADPGDGRSARPHGRGHPRVRPSLLPVCRSGGGRPVAGHCQRRFRV